MIKSTLCYIKNNNKYLMLRRDKKINDPNEGKWIGIGGKFEKGETHFDCVKREVFEETNIEIDNYHFHGIIEFRSETFEDEDMYLFSAMLPCEYSDRPLIDCNEGTLAWIDANEIMALNLWEGDKYFLEKLISGDKDINMQLFYDKNGKLVTVK